MYKRFIKAFLDIIIAVLASLILLPVFLVVAIFLTVSNKGNCFFIQPRPGKNGKIFKIVKFKTMNEKTGMDGTLLPDDERLTPVGIIIRKFSLDEIPQLFNVIKGDMSLIGPRPLLPEYLPLYSSEQFRRHEVKPGITGWAQVNGRNAIDWQQKFKYDLYYVDNVSFILDLRILYWTLRKVVADEGISSGTSATMERFIGNN